jgi:monovalent cation:H+ antiporter-2, CPA2 family
MAVIIALEDQNNIRLVCEAIAETAQEPVIVVREAGVIEKNLLVGLPIKSRINERDEVARILIQHATSCAVPL